MLALTNILGKQHVAPLSAGLRRRPGSAALQRLFRVRALQKGHRRINLAFVLGLLHETVPILPRLSSRPRPLSGSEDVREPSKEMGTRAARRSRGVVTLEDVAKLAGVSSMTVSRVLNRPDTVSSQTETVVRKAIDKTGYVPNLLAGALASNKTRMVAVIVPSISSSLFSACIQSLTDRLDEAGYQMLLGLSGYPAAREERLLSAILSRRPDALVLTGTNHSVRDRRRLKGAKIPIVEIWDLSRKPVDMAVGFSHAAVGKAVADYLLGKGYRRFAIVGADDERARLRWTSYVQVLRANGISDVAEIITPAPTNLWMGRDGLSRLIAGGFQQGAIFCSSDSLAHGVLLEAQARGMTIPRDIAVIGFGDTDIGAFTVPALSTVRIDRFAVGRFAADCLLSRLDGNAVSRKTIDVGFEVIERDTT
jgi:LacI family gluconate utilization system Gnt-I transcriptional repressor